MDKYGTTDLEGQQQAELDDIRRRLALLRAGSAFALTMRKEAADSEMRRLEERERALEHALGAGEASGPATA